MGLETVGARVKMLARAALVGVVSTGCGGGDPSARVSGNISVNGTPLVAGTVMFIPIEGTAGGIAGATVTNGAYAITKGLGPGQYRVEVRQPRPSERLVPKPFGAPGEMVEGTEEGIDEAFNEKSTLRAALDRGANSADFRVTHRP
jgi:hypothetical protein